MNYACMLILVLYTALFKLITNSKNDREPKFLISLGEAF